MQDGFRWKLSCGLLGTLSARGQSSKDPGIASVEVGFLEGEVVLAMVLNYEPKGQQHCFVLVCGTETVQFCALFSFLFFSFFLFFFFPHCTARGSGYPYMSFYSFIWLHLWHMEVPGLGVKSELQLQAYATATAMPDPSCLICNLHHSSRQCQILNPLTEAKDQTCILMDTSHVHFH